MKQQQRIALSVALILALSGSSVAFTPLHPRISQNPALVSSKTLAEPGTYRSHRALHLSNGRSDNDIKEDWNALTKAAGNFARDVGSRVVDAVKTGGNKLKDFVTATLLPPSPEKDTTTAARGDSFISNPIVDTEDEDMFRGIFGEDLFDPLTMPSPDSIDHGHVLEQADMLLQESQVATSLLGYSLQYGSPFSQGSHTTTVNGKTSTSVQASFEVWGTMGQGVATVTSNDGNLEFMDLQVNGRMYRLDAHSSPSSSNFNSRRTNPEPSTWAGYDAPSTYAEQDDAMEVEVLEGVRGRSAYNGRIMDAEILGKTIL